jgi:hypothetical protein
VACEKGETYLETLCKKIYPPEKKKFSWHFDDDTNKCYLAIREHTFYQLTDFMVLTVLQMWFASLKIMKIGLVSKVPCLQVQL